MTHKYFFAVDLGATSGRTIVGGLSDGKITLEELTRFDNNLIEVNGHFYWDIYALYFEVVKGLKAARQISKSPQSVLTLGALILCALQRMALSVSHLHIVILIPLKL
jgi:rhamnulokinase